MIKLLIGGSPCTKWSIAQRNRETKAEGIGWELFENYDIARRKFKPDFFLYENNWSASKEIKAQIQEVLGCKLMRINSRLVSAQNRDRFYVFNWDVEQPKDRGVLLKDILENGYPYNPIDGDKSHTITANYHKMSNNLNSDFESEKNKQRIAQIIRVGTYPTENGELKGSQGQRIYAVDGKSVTQSANGGGQGAKTGLYAVPVGVSKRTFPRIPNGELRTKRIEARQDEKLNCITSVQTDSMVAIPSDKPIYQVKNGIITIKGKSYPIKLSDGNYTIRKLTPVECERLQTLPDNYTQSVSNTQRYKGLGNGWTAEVIIHVLQGALKDIPRDEKIVVLSMYDGIGTGRYCLDKMGFKNVEYHAYEIDKYAIKIAMSNYPDIIQHGNAFDVRKEDWHL